jgi:SAM-dependent methyltransferase
LDAGLALKEIHRVLKPGGRLLLQEPLADNPFLKLFRKLTPKARTEDEKPFTAKDLKNLKQSTQWQPELCFCGLLEAPIAMLTSVLMPGHPDNFILSAVDRLEGIFHHAGILDAWNQYVLINLVKRG